MLFVSMALCLALCKRLFPLQLAHNLGKATLTIHPSHGF